MKCIKHNENVLCKFEQSFFSLRFPHHPNMLNLYAVYNTAKAEWIKSHERWTEKYFVKRESARQPMARDGRRKEETGKRYETNAF